jgi:hypothetical protein
VRSSMETWAGRTAERSETVRYDTRKEVIWVSHEGKCGKEKRPRGSVSLLGNLTLFYY